MGNVIKKMSHLNWLFIGTMTWGVVLDLLFVEAIYEIVCQNWEHLTQVIVVFLVVLMFSLLAVHLMFRHDTHQSQKRID